jgi:hypothetical protein
MAFPPVTVIDHRRPGSAPIKVVRVRTSDQVRQWRSRDTDEATSEIARYPMSWHDIEQDRDKGDWIIRKRETARSMGDQMLTPGTTGPLRQNGEKEFDIHRDVLGHKTEDADRIRAKEQRQRTADQASLRSMNARNRSFWSGRGG